MLLGENKTGERYREADFGRFPEEFGCLAPNVISSLTLRLRK